MSYLFVLAGGVGAVGIAFVEVVVVSSGLLQPVNAVMPIARPNSATRVYILFIVGVTFTKFPKRTSKILVAINLIPNPAPIRR